MTAAGQLPADMPLDFGYVTDAAQKQAQQHLARLVPNAKHITNTNSARGIHKAQSQPVIDSIRELVENCAPAKSRASRAGKIREPWTESYPSQMP